MKKELVVASNNSHKIEEIRAILKNTAYNAISMKEKGIFVEVEEDQNTFSDNAKKKALEIHRITGGFVCADDSGIEIDFLNKAPGIYSARFAGYNTPYSKKNQLILDIFEEIPEQLRTARYVCAICLVLEDGTTHLFEDTFEGMIHTEALGEHGFGYDPIFYIPEYKLTAAQLNPDQKNKISHRAKALEKMKLFLTEYNK